MLRVLSQDPRWLALPQHDLCTSRVFLLIFLRLICTYLYLFRLPFLKLICICLYLYSLCSNDVCTCICQLCSNTSLKSCTDEPDFYKKDIKRRSKLYKMCKYFYLQASSSSSINIAQQKYLFFLSFFCTELLSGQWCGFALYHWRAEKGWLMM